MTEQLAAARPYLESAAFLATIILAIGVLVSWRQLVQIRTEARVRVLREAQSQAIIAADEYMRIFCEASCNGEEVLEKYGTYAGPVGDFTLTSIPERYVDRALKKMDEDAYRVGFNLRESIAARFTSGVADERTGFEIIGRSFCSAVRSNYDVLSAFYDGEAVPHWKDIVTLYAWWSPRIESRTLEQSADQIKKRLSSMRDVDRKPTGLQ